MEFAIFWILTGGLTAAVAAAKGRSALLWAGLGVVGGVFALAYVAFAPKVEPERTDTRPLSDWWDRV